MSDDREHALLSASGARKWLHCPAAPRLEENFPDTPSPYAEEGRLAHKLAEATLRATFGLMPNDEYVRTVCTIREDPLFNAAMAEYVQSYADQVKSIVYAFPSRPYVAVERRVDYGYIAPDGFGTADCIVIGGDILHVLDFKYGAGVEVDAYMNPQMMLYALGALRRYAALYDIHTVRMTIVQPRKENVTTCELPVRTLTEWGETVKPIAQKAYYGQGECTPGDWCSDGFCRVRNVCRARAEHNLRLERYGARDPHTLSDAELGEILTRAKALADWVSDAQEYAQNRIMQGEELPGWKVVEGRKVRAFQDQPAAFKALVSAGIDEALLYKREPIAFTDAEKLTGKKRFEELLGGQIIRKPGKPTLVPACDPREPMSFAVTAADVFKAAGT